MVIVMDMTTGKIEKPTAEEAAAEEFGQFVDEILDAGWLPQPATQLAEHEHVAKPRKQEIDADAFLRELYRNQE